MAPRPSGMDIVVELRRCPREGAHAAARLELMRLLEELAAAQPNL